VTRKTRRTPWRRLLVSIIGYKLLEGLRKIGRELQNGCDRTAAIGTFRLSTTVTLARAKGTRRK
jgi:hypothetical protein